MAGFPYRVAIWRRMRQARPGTVRRVALYLPAVLGTLILLLVVPIIGRLLSTEVELLDATINSLQVRTECDGLSLYIRASPAPAGELSLPGASSDTLTPEVLVTARRSPGGPCGPVEVSATSLKPWSQRGLGNPTVTGTRGGVVTVDASRGFSLEFGNSDQVDVTLAWPGLYQYAHIGRGLVNRWIGDRAAATSFHVQVTPLSGIEGFNTDPRDASGLPSDPRSRSVYLELTIETPLLYDVVDAYDYRQLDRYEFGVIWGNETTFDGTRPANIIGNAGFRTPAFEAQTNYITLAGGSLIGLGITLLVETLIAALFFFERGGFERPTTTPVAVEQPAPPGPEPTVANVQREDESAEPAEPDRPPDDGSEQAKPPEEAP